MRFITVLAAAAAAILVAVGVASAGSPDGAAGPWADSVVQYTPGLNAVGTAVLAERSDPNAALGVPEAKTGNDDPIPTGTFVSLGYGGSITLGFETATCIKPGSALSIEVREITKEPYPPETAEVAVSADNVNYVIAGTISRDATLPVPAGVTEVRYVRLVDHSDTSMLTTKGAADDGFDIDGVQVLDTVGCAPPAPKPTTTACSAAYWTSSKVVKKWRVKSTLAFNQVFRVTTFPRKSMFGVAKQPGGSSRALGRESVFALLTAMTPSAKY